MTSTSEYLICKGVKTHNLKNIHLNIPLKKWIAITGVSGSGKSSLAFDTIYSESQRRFLETLGTYERQFLQGLPQGDFDEIDNIPAAVSLKQNNKTGDPRSVIASAADIATPLRTLFISLMDPSCTNCGSPVNVDTSNQLIELLTNENSKENKLNYIISVPYTIDSKKNLDDLIFEGYTRGIIENKIIDFEDFIKENSLKNISMEIILDRINWQLSTEEISNRIETIWSQVKFSPRFSYLNLVKLNSNKEITNDNQVFHVQPFCSSCHQQTSIIQTNDLDWQSILGACQTCNGLGNVPILDPQKIIPNPNLSIAEGAIKPWNSDTFLWMKEELIRTCKKRNIKIQGSYSNLSKDVKNFIWYGDSSNKKSSDTEYVTLKNFFDILEQERYKSTSRILLAKYRKYEICTNCNGARVGKAGLNAICFGVSYSELFQKEISSALRWLEKIKLEKKYEKKLNAIPEIYDEAFKKISLLEKLGLGSAQLFRRCKTLSGGEYQRVLLTRVIGNGLTDALYVLDEPSIGLGKKEIPSLIKCIEELRDLGNTVLMVEHDKTLISSADEILELGPGGGENGGKLLKVIDKKPNCFQTKFSKLNLNLTKKNIFPLNSYQKENSIILKGFSAMNCREIDIEFILKKLNIIIGPSGAGKSTLIRFGLEAALDKYKETNISENSEYDSDAKIGIWQHFILPKNFFENNDIISVEQKALHRTISSVPATILGLMDLLRKNFAATREAKALGFNISDFSFNGVGGCENCNGKGTIEDDLFFLGSVEKICPDCNGSRYRSDILEIKWNQKSIHEWLSTSMAECLKTLGKQSGFSKALLLCNQLGLGHIPLGLPTTSMSGGEAQRLRICAALSKSSKKIFCILDEPTRGLSDFDIGNLLETLLRLCSEGHTFVVVEHHELFEEHAHHLIKMGPESGVHGGKIIERLLAVAQE
ncbi:ATP-binding cassette domain-containing protein [Fluviispira multicolorata]|uniref:UvrABC system protein A n=1 Tax=Fluviispira multicolorata TaxID=2654512 RepID=A0A833N700_9BACT|nr:ATP-binding cassette domain-containing protein [Fluviispira multicolorata]KAB8031058.1 ATP-binding cassette domain-containing protein [Fluviispira multicolorata]